jgi:quercetin dioxygenase-like cupin family protein
VSNGNFAERRGYVRRASECLVAIEVGGAELHRAAHNSVIDYRLQEAMQGGGRGVGTVPGFCSDKPSFSSPWHHHDCEMQIGIVLDGSVEMAFADGDFSRIGKWDIGMIPGGVAHDVSNPSADFLTTEFTFPGTFATIETPPPPFGTPTNAVKWGMSDAVRTGEERGLLFYSYPVNPAYADRYAVGRERRSRVAPFVSASITHDEDYRLYYLTQGTRTFELNGEPHRLNSGDLLVLPGGVECTDLDASEEHELVTITLRLRDN